MRLKYMQYKNKYIMFLTHFRLQLRVKTRCMMGEIEDTADGRDQGMFEWMLLNIKSLKKIVVSFSNVVSLQVSKETIVITLTKIAVRFTFPPRTVEVSPLSIQRAARPVPTARSERGETGRKSESDDRKDFRPSRRNSQRWEHNLSYIIVP